MRLNHGTPGDSYRRAAIACGLYREARGVKIVGYANEPTALVIVDMIVDLGHLFDRLQDRDREEYETFWQLLMTAADDYQKEGAMHPDQLDDLIRRSDDHVGAEPDDNKPDAWADPSWPERVYDAAGNCLDFGCEGNNVSGCEHGSAIIDVAADAAKALEVRLSDGRTIIFATVADAIRAAHEILSDAETYIREQR